MQNANDQLSIVNTKKVLDVKHADLDGSQFETIKMCHAQFKQVWMAELKIVDANLSDLEIDGAQIGGAYIHHIGMPRKGNPAYIENAKQRPVRFRTVSWRAAPSPTATLNRWRLTIATWKGQQ